MLSLCGQRTTAILQRLCLIRDDIEMNDSSDQFAETKQHEFIHIRSSNDTTEQERVISANPVNAKNKDKKKRA